MTGIKETLFLMISDFAFSSIIFIWYILYKLGLNVTNPLFALLITFIQNIIVLSILLKKKKITKDNALRYGFILFILKFLPLLSFFPNYLNFTLKDIIITVYIYIIYMLIIIIIIEIFGIDIDLTKIMSDDFFGENYEKTFSTKIYDYTYDEIISKIF